MTLSRRDRLFDCLVGEAVGDALELPKELAEWINDNGQWRAEELKRLAGDAAPKIGQTCTVDLDPKQTGGN